MLSLRSQFAAQALSPRAVGARFSNLVGHIPIKVVVGVVPRVVCFGSQSLGVNVSLAQPERERDASTCGTALAGQAQRHRSRARYACCWARFEFVAKGRSRREGVRAVA